MKTKTIKQIEREIGKLMNRIENNAQSGKSTLKQHKRDLTNLKEKQKQLQQIKIFQQNVLNVVKKKFWLIKYATPKEDILEYQKQLKRRLNEIFEGR